MTFEFKREGAGGPARGRRNYRSVQTRRHQLAIGIQEAGEFSGRRLRRQRWGNVEWG